MAIRVRALLRKRCEECHGPGTKYGDLSDAAGVQKFIKPSDPYLLHLVEDGSMPPGTAAKLSLDDVRLLRAWIDAGAPAYPKSFGRDYAVQQVVRDAGRRPDEENAFFHYLSLAHLVGDDAISLQPRRNELRKAVRDLSKANGSAVVAVDPANTVFRIDLRQLGWDERRFAYAGASDKDKPRPATENVFDLILLEYGGAKAPAAAQRFLAAAGQAAPTAFLDGDWLARDFRRTQAGDEFRRVFHPDEPVDPVPAQPSPRQFNLAEARNRILPFDCLSHAEIGTEPAPFALRSFEARDGGQKPQTQFKLHDRFAVFVSCDADIWVELVITNALGEARISSPQQVPGKEGLTFRPADDTGYELLTPGTVTITLYASRQQFPSGRVLRDRRFQAWLDQKGDKKPFEGGFVDRVVHHFYTSAPADFDPAGVVKKTTTIEVAKLSR